MAKISIESTDRSIDTPVYVVMGSRTNLLGRPQMRLLNLLFDIKASVTNSRSLGTVVDKGITSDSQLVIQEMSEVSEGGEKDSGKRDEGRATGGSEQRGNGMDKGDSEKGKVSKTYGKKGNIYCIICRERRDHAAADCPGNFCNRCNGKGHWARSCTKPYCKWCNAPGHDVADCPEGGANFVKG